MTSFIDCLAANEKTAVIIDIGHAYTKCGFAGNSSPRHIIPTTISVNGKTQHVFDDSTDSLSLRDRLVEFIRLVYYKYNIANCRDRRVVIVESVVTPSRLRHLIADILLRQFESSSLAFVPSHLGATHTLGRCTALVLDVGYKEAQVMPVAEGVPLAVQFDSLPCAGQAIHKQIELLLVQHASVTHDGQKKAFAESNLKLSEETLEDIKVRCCFVSPLNRAQVFAKHQLDPNESFQEASTVNYPLDPETTIHIPGIVREFACEILFEQDIDGKSVATLILDNLIQSSLDLRRQFADNILVVGGTAMLPGFLHRLDAELTHLVYAPTYVNKLAIKQFHFHSPPAQLNYAAWLGGSIIGALDTLESQSIIREKYLENGIVPDWFTGEQAA